MKNRIIGIILIIIGIGISYYSIGIIKQANEKQKTYIETTAVVVGYEDCDLEDSIGQSFIAEYKVDRNTYRIKENACSNTPRGLNSEVKIKYNPNDPNDAVFSNDISHYIITLVGIVFIISGFIFTFKKNY